MIKTSKMKDENYQEGTKHISTHTIATLKLYVLVINTAQCIQQTINLIKKITNKSCN